MKATILSFRDSRRKRKIYNILKLVSIIIAIIVIAIISFKCGEKNEYNKMNKNIQIAKESQEKKIREETNAGIYKQIVEIAKDYNEECSYCIEYDLYKELCSNYFIYTLKNLAYNLDNLLVIEVPDSYDLDKSSKEEINLYLDEVEQILNKYEYSRVTAIHTNSNLEWLYKELNDDPLNNAEEINRISTIIKQCNDMLEFWEQDEKIFD